MKLYLIFRTIFIWYHRDRTHLELISIYSYVLTFIIFFWHCKYIIFLYQKYKIVQSLTSMTAGDFVPQNIYLMHSAIFFKHRPQVILIHVVRYLSHKHLYVVRIRLLHAVVVHYTVMWKGSLCGMCSVLNMRAWRKTTCRY